jgi:hypothetical protein
MDEKVESSDTSQEQIVEITPKIDGRERPIDPKVYEIVLDGKRNGRTYKSISEELRNKGFEVNPTKARQIYLKGSAQNIVEHTEAKEIFNEYTDELREMYGDSLELMGIYLKEIKKLLKQIQAAEDDDSMSTKIMTLKTLPTAVSLFREIRESVDTNISIQDKITKVANKEVIYNDGQILETLNKYWPTFVKEKIKKLKELYPESIPINKFENEMKLMN